jgi:S-adenosylmethionine:tRNA ribosyltransferase-isomerase
VSAPAFNLPAALEAHEPPEARGLARDAVRLMVGRRRDGRIRHARFRDLGAFLASGDLLVVNTSATLPSAITARRRDGTTLQVRFATAAPHLEGDAWWVVELRTAGGAAPLPGRWAGERLELDGGAALEVAVPYAGGSRLWLARVELDGTLHAHLARHGTPIRYGYVPAEWPLDAYQTVFATTPGSAEMPSAGRPFTPELVTRLTAAGVLVAPVLLHAGVSSPERHETPYPERYAVPATTARLVNAVRGWGGRVVAVGTTVVRALETVAAPDGTVDAGEGWTGLVVTPDRAARRRRPAHRLARAGRVAPAAAGGRRGRRAAGPLLRRGARARVPLARVRRQPPHRALSAAARPWPRWWCSRPSAIALPPPRRTGSAAASIRPPSSSSTPVAAPIWAPVPVLTVNTWPRASSAAASGVPRNSASVCVVGALRWLSRGAAIASGSERPKSTRSSSSCVTVVMIDAPPGEPSASHGRPSRSTMVGAMDERGRLPPATWFALFGLLPSEPRLKSVSSLLRRNP